jgi:RNA polymerase sigma-70 factor (ECF subfamily)
VTPADVPNLTARIAGGDEDAFRAFYHLYSPQVYRLLLAIVRGNESIAEELHQQVMIKAAQKMPRLADEEQLWKWLSQVARNAWRDLLRRERRKGEALELLKAGLPQGPALSSEPCGLASLTGALKSLSTAQRDLVESFYLESLPQKQIASRTGLTVKAIQCELARIRKKLRAILTKEDDAN